MTALIMRVNRMTVLTAAGMAGLASSPIGMAAIEFIMHVLRIPHWH